uniref:GPI alpha-1,4-mannosyltransferase I, catalytic subunit n=1 Tax=Sarcoptes scabiei TaxID=52283 RepID=A0A834R097_SARSC
MTSLQQHLNSFKEQNLRTHLSISFLLHLVMIGFAEIQDYILDVKFTDIDYVVFSDGAQHILDGRSPFDRSTYRYTPLLALMMIPNQILFKTFGKILFSVFDIACGLIHYHLLDRNHKEYYLLWLYNPLILILSTRGSCESFISFMILFFLFLLNENQSFIAGLIYGFVIHFKIYPIIYAFSIYLTMSDKTPSLLSIFWLNKDRIKFISAASLGLFIPSYISYAYYGQTYFDEAWLFHLIRQDLQHNFSPYFYIYRMASSVSIQKLISYFAFIPQIVFNVYIAFYYNFEGKISKFPNLYKALFLQTYFFVIVNKVITAQYFEWYICFLPLVFPFLDAITLQKWAIIFFIWMFSILQWLLPAYLFEFRQWQCFHWLGFSSILFVIINIFFIFYFHLKFDVKTTLEKSKKS